MSIVDRSIKVRFAALTIGVVLIGVFVNGCNITTSACELIPATGSDKYDYEDFEARLIDDIGFNAKIVEVKAAILRYATTNQSLPRVFIGTARYGV